MQPFNQEYCVRLSNIPRTRRIEQRMYEEIWKINFDVKSIRRLETETFCSLFVYLKDTTEQAHKQLANTIRGRRFEFRPQTTLQTADIRILFPEVRKAKDLPEWVYNWTRERPENGATFVNQMRGGAIERTTDRTLYNNNNKYEIWNNLPNRFIVTTGLRELEGNRPQNKTNNDNENVENNNKNDDKNNNENNTNQNDYKNNNNDKDKEKQTDQNESVDENNNKNEQLDNSFSSQETVVEKNYSKNREETTDNNEKQVADETTNKDEKQSTDETTDQPTKTTPNKKPSVAQWMWDAIRNRK